MGLPVCADASGYICLFLYGWTLWLFLSWLPQYFKNQYSLDLKDSALFATAVFLAGSVVAFWMKPDEAFSFAGGPGSTKNPEIVPESPATPKTAMRPPKPVR